ncbi:MAG: protein-L-isoaspartate O-methyltransferase [Pseudomonadota bacterium]
MNVEFARHQMVYQQVRGWDVGDERVLDVMAAMPREQFVPDAWRSSAFADAEIPLGHGERMLKPNLEGRLLQSLQLNPTDTVLHIGCGSGYLTACLSQLAGRVLAVDQHEDFIARSRERISALAIDDVEFDKMDVAKTLPEQRFDALLVGGSVATDASPMERLLREGGRMVAVLGAGPAMTATRVTRTAEERWQREALFETWLAPLAGFEPPQEFVF